MTSSDAETDLKPIIIIIIIIICSERLENVFHNGPMGRWANTVDGPYSKMRFILGRIVPMRIQWVSLRIQRDFGQPPRLVQQPWQDYMNLANAS